MQVPATIEKLQKFAADADGSTHEKAQLKEAAQQVADEMLALQSIFGDENVDLLPIQRTSKERVQAPTFEGPTDWNYGTPEADFDWHPEQAIRLCITVPMDLQADNNQSESMLSFKLSATLPVGYPQLPKPPQLQLLSRYIGPHGVDHSLFGQVLRLFHQGGNSKDHIEFHQGDVTLFDGIEKVREKVEEWYSEREAEQLQRKEDDEVHRPAQEERIPGERGGSPGPGNTSAVASNEMPVGDLKGVNIITAPAIIERKSVFLGHCAYLSDVSQVPMVLSEVLKDRKVARATHPTIHAWICKEKGSGVVHRDYDDDGETAAGGRLAHLLDLLHLENVVVVVTRWYGGVQLGPDRFKLINRAARDALEVAQLVAGPLNPTSPALKSNSKKT